jgi:hypothetical protein
MLLYNKIVVFVFRKYSGQSGTGRNIFGVLHYFPVIIISPVFHILLSVVWGWMNCFRNYLKIREGEYNTQTVVLLLTTVLVVTVDTCFWLGG